MRSYLDFQMTFLKNYRKTLNGISEGDLLTQADYLLSNDRLSGSVISEKNI